MTDIQLETLVSGIKNLEAGQKENKESIKELQTAMIGTVDGRRKGFGQQLLSVMEAMDKLAPRIEHLEKFMVRSEGAWAGGKVTIAFIGGLIGLATGVIAMLLRK